MKNDGPRLSLTSKGARLLKLLREVLPKLADGKPLSDRQETELRPIVQDAAEWCEQEGFGQDMLKRLYGPLVDYFGIRVR